MVYRRGTCAHGISMCYRKGHLFYYCTIHGAWKVGTLVQPMVHGNYIPYRLYTIIVHGSEYHCPIYAPGEVDTLYNPWCMETMYLVHPCTIHVMEGWYPCTIHGAWNSRTLSTVVRSMPMEVEYPCTNPWCMETMYPITVVHPWCMSSRYIFKPIFHSFWQLTRSLTFYFKAFTVYSFGLPSTLHCDRTTMHNNSFTTILPFTRMQQRYNAYLSLHRTTLHQYITILTSWLLNRSLSWDAFCLLFLFIYMSHFLFYDLLFFIFFTPRKDNECLLDPRKDPNYGRTTTRTNRLRSFVPAIITR